MTVMTRDLRVELVGREVDREMTHHPTFSRPIRPCMLLSVGMIIAGMGFVFLMVLGIMPVNFLTAFLGFALTASGGTMSLIFCGDI